MARVGIHVSHDTNQSFHCEKQIIPLSLSSALYLFAPSHTHTLPGALGLQRGLLRLKDPFSETPKNCTANFLITLSHHEGQ